mmetsp:Transcript_11184/g.22276  ORF Transcript_11184/g.22276 Transcript_11184/m.22276 type:complete len:95 (+) Transcript_11184:190-474(+)
MVASLGFRYGVREVMSYGGGVRRWAAAVASSPSARAAAAAKRDPTPKLSGSKLDPSESFMTGTNATVLEQMYELYKSDPDKVRQDMGYVLRVAP